MGLKVQLRECALLFILLLSLSGCSEVKDLTPEQAIRDEVAYWSSEEFEGRQAGTAANEKVRDELAKRFKNIGLNSVFQEDFFHSFTMPFLNPDDIEKSLVVHMQDGSKKEFTYGEDWMEKSSEPNLHVELPISFQESKDHILVTEKQKPPSDEIRVQFVKSDLFSKVLTSYNPDSSSFQITESLFNYLQENEKEINKVGLIYAGRRTPVTVDNVIGKIPAENTDSEKRAIIISAHFDHVGQTGANTFLGSIDNATGLTALLKIAEELSEQAEKEAFSSDIIFAAFNAEENGLLGSQAFVNEISSQYDSIANINLDCIGYKDGGRISFRGALSGGAVLGDELSALAKEMDIEVYNFLEESTGLYSDHIPFLNNFFHAIMITQEHYPSIHSIEDNMDQVEVGPIIETIDLVFEFVKKNHGESFLPTMMQTHDDAYERESLEHRKDLKFGEYKTYQSEVTGNLETVLNLERELTTEEFPLFESPLDSQGFKIKSAQVRYTPKDEFIPSQDNAGEITKFTEEELVMNAIQVDVVKDEDNLYIQIVSNDVDLPFNNESEIFGEWQIWKNQSGSGESYSRAVKKIEEQNHTFTLLIQGTFTKSTLESFVQSFPLDTTINLLIQ